MRIVGGAFKGRVLLSPEGKMTRPTADRVRESLFNILASDDGVEDKAVLDVFAGTGALGFEALSRGAAQVGFVETDPNALSVISQNIKKLGVTDRAKILRFDATKPPKSDTPFDLILLDPPYRSGLARQALDALGKRGWIAPEPIIVVELSTSEPFPAPDGLAITDERKYGAARLVFMAREPS